MCNVLSRISVIPYLTNVRLQFRVNCLHMLFETFAVGKHLVTNVALLGFSPGGHAGCQGVQVDHCVVLQLAHLVESLVTDVTDELLEVEVGLVVRLQDLGEHRPIVATGSTHLGQV